MEQLQELINNKIDYFKNAKGINEDQFKVISIALKKVTSQDELNALVALFDSRVGFGFKFDAAPHIKDVTSIPILQKDLLHQIKSEPTPTFNFNSNTPHTHTHTPEWYFDNWRKFWSITKFINYSQK